MKSHLLVVAMCSLSAVAADFPTAADRLSDCENRWVLVEGKDPASRTLGFAYVDPTRGVTIEHNGEVGISTDGILERKPFELQGKARLIVRVETDYEVACLSEAQLTELGVPATPEWLDWYRDSRAAGPHNVAWASAYNHIGAFARALKHIDAARSEGFESRDLTFEHGYALNAVGRYQDALTILEPGVKTYPRDVNIRAELGYAQLNLRQFAKAIKIYERAYSMDKHGASGRKDEFAQNIAVAYTQLGDHKEAAKWRALAKEAKPNDSGRPTGVP